MQLIVLYGLPGVGKLTVAKALAETTGYRLFHNHLTVDLLLSTFAFGTPEFVALREEIWLSVFDRAVRSGVPGMLFTFAPEATVRPTFLPQAIATIERGGGSIAFAELVCSLPILRGRLDQPTRRAHGKLTSPALFDDLLHSGRLTCGGLPAPALTIDTGRLAPADAANRIIERIGLPPARRSPA